MKPCPTCGHSLHKGETLTVNGCCPCCGYPMDIAPLIATSALEVAPDAQQSRDDFERLYGHAGQIGGKVYDK